MMTPSLAVALEQDTRSFDADFHVDGEDLAGRHFRKIVALADDQGAKAKLFLSRRAHCDDVSR